MIELLYTVITILGISIIFYFVFASFQFFKIYFYFFQLLISILLLSLNPYKKNYLWEEPDFNSVQELPYLPINNINIIYDSNNNIIDINATYSSKEYSFIETKDFSKLCFENYYIKNNESCPITDIIVEYNDINTYSDYEKIKINNGFIYYKKNYNYGQLYDSIHISWAYTNKYIEFANDYKTIKFSYSFDYKNIETIKRLEENKIIKPFKVFRDYINIVDLICLFLLIYSIIYFLIENKNDDQKWNYFKIIDNILQLIMFILYLIRFILYEKVKKFFKDNKDLYNDEYLEFNRTKYFNKYFPNNYSINSFPLSISMVMIFAFFLSLIIKDKWSFQKDFFNFRFNNNKFFFFNNDKKCRIWFFSFTFIIIYFICFILDIINDMKIKKIYSSYIINWDKSPISLIELNSIEEYELGHLFTKNKKIYFYSWKNNYFTIKRNQNYNYMNIFPINGKEGKKCGKDSFGNDLFFPKDVECPINDIFFENNNDKDYPDYKKLNLGFNNYLYYTNKKTDKNIIIDIKIGIPSISFQLNNEETNEICNYIYEKGFHKEMGGKCLKYNKFNTIPFFNEIDHWDFYDFFQNIFELKKINYFGEIYLYSLTYQGINSTSIKNRNIIKDYKKKIEDFIPLSIVKNVFGSFNFIYYTFFSFLLVNDQNDTIILIISLIFIGLSFFHFIIIISCLALNIQLVQNCMNKINNDFERHKNNYAWILFIFFLDLFFLAYYIGITCNIFLSRNCCLSFDIREIWNKLRQKISSCCNRNNRNIGNYSNNSNNRIPQSNNQNNGNLSESRNINRNLCIICCQRNSNIAIINCGHKCYCFECYQTARNNDQNNCPI